MALGGRSESDNLLVLAVRVLKVWKNSSGSFLTGDKLDSSIRRSLCGVSDPGRRGIVERIELNRSLVTFYRRTYITCSPFLGRRRCVQRWVLPGRPRRREKRNIAGRLSARAIEAACARRLLGQPRINEGKKREFMSGSGHALRQGWSFFGRKHIGEIFFGIVVPDDKLTLLGQSITLSAGG